MRILEAERSENFAERVCRTFYDRIECTRVAIGQIHRVSTRIRAAYWPRFAVEEEPVRARAFRRDFLHHPRIQMRLRGKAPKTVLCWSDLPDLRPFRASRLYREFYQPDGITDQLSMRLPGPRPLLMGLTIDRSGGNFTETEKQAMTQLHHVLEAIFRRVTGSELAGALAQAGWGRMLITPGGEIIEVDRRAHEIGAVFDHDLADGSALSSTPWWPAICDRIEQELVAIGSSRNRVESFSAGGVDFLVEHRLLGLPTLYLHAAAPISRRTRFVTDLDLTPRQAEVADLLVQGLRIREVAARLGISFSTASTHLEHIYARLGTNNRARAIAVLLGDDGPPGQFHA
ncbi:MAG: response regulator transcription factor [Beutenbergiaceae bacterium]